MDIRSFFGKKPASKPRPSAPGKKKAEQGASPAAAKKRKTSSTAATENDGGGVEISPKDFFALPAGDRKAKTKEVQPRKTEKEPAEAKTKKKAESEAEIASPVGRRSPRRPVRAAKAEAGEPRKQSKRRVIQDDDDDDDDDGAFVGGAVDESDEDFEPASTPSKPGSKSRSKSKPSVPEALPTPSPAAKRGRGTKSKSPASTKPVLCEPGIERDSFDTDAVRVPECMAGAAFVFTGVMDGLGREDAIDLVKTLGGRVTTAVSGKTDYLVVGPLLEDGRGYREGSKYRKAVSYGEGEVRIVEGEKQLYGLCHSFHDRAAKEQGVEAPRPPLPGTKAPAAASRRPPVSNPYGKAAASSGAPPSNPYARKGPVANPYARKAPSNPYAKKAPANPYARAAASSSSTAPAPAPRAPSDPNSLWVDRHKPTSTREILGNATNVKKLQAWLRTWERTFNNPKAANKSFGNPRGPFKAALLSGPPGIGKTTTATLVAREDGRDVLEYNASDTRSKKALQFMGDLTGSHGISFQKTGAGGRPQKPSVKKRCIIMDEVDGMGGGDRSGISELIQMIKKSKTPIICICNDRQSQKIKSLLPYCMDLRYSRPTKNSLANRAVRIAEMEGLVVERNAAEAIAESCGNDVRQVLNLLQMWAQKKHVGGENDNSLTYKKLKDRGRSIQKDEMLRVSLFDAAKLIVEGPRDLQQADDKAKLDSLFKRLDAFFVDYSFTGLIVQQNYPKVTNSQYQRIKGDDEAEIQLLERFHKAADSMSDYDMVESQIRGGDLNWSLLPTTSMLAVKTGYHAGGDTGGFLGGFPEFTAWMGKNSSMGKNYRLLSELSHHMNYKVSANDQELRQAYVPVLRDRILGLLSRADPDANKEAIDLMDDYGLSRDDVVDKLNVLILGKKDFSFEDLDSKAKAAFTRQYNAGSHRSQALIREQGGGAGGGAKKKRKRAPITDEDEEAIGDSGDDQDSSEDELDEEKELARLQAQFKKKGRKKAAPKKKSKK
ncbi:unnamed protein product [Pseudo-nitzschia multistriata]|uniref:Replication factor C subunit 1 n=1 Tax=Pseudo-nitzschia multistriata TaxID=183589 RepID=A0A448YV84_9STRA|nr:unnamed protein product [Pseudo-nitzschia multistriata]